MPPKRRRSLLEDDELFEVGSKDEASSSDVCERCGRTRGQHEADDKPSKCEEFVE